MAYKKHGLMNEKYQHLIFSELHMAISENGQEWVLNYLRKRNDTDLFTSYLLEQTCSVCNISRNEFLNAKSAVGARRIFASLMRKRGYSYRKIQIATNKSRSVICEYIRYITEIEASDRLKILFNKTISALAELEQKAEEYGKQRA